MDLAQYWFDILYMALAMQGEGARLFGNQEIQVAQAIGDVIMDRLAANNPHWGPGIPKIVTNPNGFHGWVNVKGHPSAWAVRVAIDRRFRLTSTLPVPVYHMLDKGDLIRNNWYQFAGRAIKSFIGPKGHEEHFFDVWPKVWEAKK